MKKQLLRFLDKLWLSKIDSPLMPNVLEAAKPATEQVQSTMSRAQIKRIDEAFKNPSYARHEANCRGFCPGCWKDEPDKVVGAQTVDRINIIARAQADSELNP